MSAIALRRAKPADAAAIASIHVRAWREAYRGLVPDAILDGLSVREREAQWRERLAKDAASWTLVAARHGDVEAFCSIAPNLERDGLEIAALYVDPDAWRSGVGSTLLLAALDALRGRDQQDVTLWVFAANERARTVYERFGFVPDGAEEVDEPSGQIEIRLRAPLAQDGAE